jgi:hypothetical protein
MIAGERISDRAAVEQVRAKSTCTNPGTDKKGRGIDKKEDGENDHHKDGGQTEYRNQHQKDKNWSRNTNQPDKSGKSTSQYNPI